ncbi:phage tail tube protein [Hoeflea sp. YIM 152468]|uniref:phage tail tube protein n=1 Tax=Hoeflea sp. YIM 152468 TaxID=3031759 RepID=UPI0023DC3B23|nr:phage tail tube protein [Hoeflea sp. YIM 152468]MDF1606955.1 phage tail tube protein [Hoeflea sp. YIM 152468]
MPEALSQVDIGYGTVVRVGRGVGPTWTQIMGGETAGVPSQPPEDIDVTHFQSPGRTRETKPGLKPVADYSLELQYWPGSATDLLLMELADLTSAGSREIVLLEITPNGGSTWLFQAYLNEYVPSSSVGEKQMVAAAWKVMARVIATAAPANVLLPSISGVAQEGQVLTAIEGSWTGSPTFTYSWEEDTGAGYAAISGATDRTYTVVTANVGNPIRVAVTGTNSDGNASATSAPTADVIGA